ncbi:Calpain-type cysteine protease [Trichinella spiralis]|uniref:Calpain-type cysteine protease n=1 Tax=Trichinella spiralis TaxID=6334 RepID=A0ABR3K8J3_TRISP
MLETDFYCFTTFGYYQDCNPLLWFIILRDVVRPCPPSLREVANQCSSLKPLWKQVAEMRMRFLGTTSREAAIKVTDVISAPSSQCVDLAASFIKGYESKLEEKDKMHEQFKTCFIECGHRIDKTYETSYKKCPKNSNYETSAEINDRLMETVKSIRTKYADSTNRTVAIFVDGSLQSELQFLITEPPTTLEIHILKQWLLSTIVHLFLIKNLLIYCHVTLNKIKASKLLNKHVGA